MTLQRDVFSGKRILIVEDEALIALDIEIRLSRCGFTVIGVADNHDEAVQLALTSAPDVILMDICIRGERDGIDTATSISRFCDAPVVFLTAFADEQTTDRAAQVSPYGYILKPFDDQSLKATLKIALERYATDVWQRLLAATVNSALMGIVLANVRGETPAIEFCNDAFLRLSGLSREDVIGKRPCFLLNPADDEASSALLDALAMAAPASRTVLLHSPGGQPFWASVTLSPVRNPKGVVTHVTIYVLDVTGQRTAESALTESQRGELLGRLSAGVAHDMNNVLGAITSFASLARSALPPATSAHQDMGEIVQAARRGALLTRRLLQFSRGEQSGLDAASDLNQVLHTVRPLLEQLAGASIRLDVQIGIDHCNVSLDETSIEQILLNLVVNARDAMPTGGVVKVLVSRPREASGDLEAGHYVRLQVIDEGTGMDDALLQNIFQPTFSTKPSGKGTGLGLYSSRLLAERVGGYLTAESRPGRGSCFSLDMPITQRAYMAVEEPLEEQAGGHARGAVCLLVEDDAPLRRACVRVLQNAGFEVIEAATASAGMMALESRGRDIRLVISDIVMSGHDGYAVLSHARQHAPDAAHLLVTGDADYETEAGVAEADILWKPFTDRTLARRALEALGMPEEPAPLSADPATSIDTVVVPLQTGHKSKRVPPTVRLPCVLVVDDDRMIRRSVIRLLEAQGIRAVEASTGVEALAIASQEDVQLVIFDVYLPDIDGLQCLVEMRRHDPLLPALIVTGIPSLEIAERALRIHVQGFLRKPVEEAELLHEVNRALNEGQIARLQRKLQMAKAGDGLVSDMAVANLRFEQALAGLFMAYQPIVRAHDHSLFAYEALMRCRVDGIGPAHLLGMAESLGRIDDLGRCVHRLVAETLADMDDDTRFFINLHPLEFREDVLLAEDQPLTPFASRIVLEVTERAQLSGTDDLRSTLQHLRSAGFRIALDDLGEGYAGLSWLIKLAPDVTKLDMSLTRDIHKSRLKRELVSAMVNVSRRSRILVVAEGVENEQEARALEDLGCDLLQGYHFGRPGPLSR